MWVVLKFQEMLKVLHKINMEGCGIERNECLNSKWYLGINGTAYQKKDSWM